MLLNKLNLIKIFRYAQIKNISILIKNINENFINILECKCRFKKITNKIENTILS